MTKNNDDYFHNYSNCSHIIHRTADLIDIWANIGSSYSIAHRCFRPPRIWIEHSNQLRKYSPRRQRQYLTPQSPQHSPELFVHVHTYYLIIRLCLFVVTHRTTSVKDAFLERTHDSSSSSSGLAVLSTGDMILYSYSIPVQVVVQSRAESKTDKARRLEPVRLSLTCAG